MSTVANNKIHGSLSYTLDATLKEGHDMRVFGLGTMATLSDVHRFREMTASLHAIYTAMEGAMGSQPTGSVVGEVWGEYGGVLRRGERMGRDLADVGEAVPRVWTEEVREQEESRAERRQFISRFSQTRLTRRITNIPSVRFGRI